MYSMNYIGKFINNFREFYNEINGATLTGAIDVVVVEQPDGSFTCSPFHVRFGKLGVLRSRFKVVDLELNGEPVDVHMKLGESGEAFFVEEIPEDELESSAHLATSPIPDNGFGLFAEDLSLRRRNSVSEYPKEKLENQVSDYTKRRYTDGTDIQRPDLSLNIPKRDYQNFNNYDYTQESESLFHMEDLDDNSRSQDWPHDAPGTPKTFRAEELGTVGSAAKEVIRKISIHNDFRPIETTLKPEDIAQEDCLKTSVNNGKKKKKTKKSGTKKKNSQRKSSTSSSSSLSDSTNNNDAENKVNERLNGPLGGEEKPLSAVPKVLQDHFFSDSEINSGTLRSPASRSGTPIQSDTELDLIRSGVCEGKVGARGSMVSGQSWRWGELPEPPPPPRQTASATTVAKPLEAADSGHTSSLPESPPSEPISSDEDNALTTQSNKVGKGKSSGMLSGMFSFMKHRPSEDVGMTGLPPGVAGPMGPGAAPSTSVADGGVYLADIADGGVDPEVAALYFPQHYHSKKTAPMSVNITAATEEDYESGNGPSLPQSPASVEGLKGLDSDEEDLKIFTKGYVGLSMCGPLDPENVLVPVEIFENEAVRWEELCSDPDGLVGDPRLVVRLGDKYMRWSAAAPLLLSLLVYHRSLPRHMLPSDKRQRNASDAGSDRSIRSGESSSSVGGPGLEGDASKQHRGGYSWWNWRRSTDKQIPAQRNDEQEATSVENLESLHDIPKDKEQSSNMVGSVPDEIMIRESAVEEVVADQKTVDVSMQTSLPSLEVGGYSGSQSSEESDTGASTTLPTDTGLPVTSTATRTPRFKPPHHRYSTDKFRKTLRLSSEQIATLNLRDGMNEMVFSVTTAYQGTTRCKCNLFRWRYDDKVVISDIDGTITKSDVLGHIFPLVGKDWAQSGVAQLFTKIKNNGYKLLYLSARAIGQAKVTREYLRSIKQGDLSLPDGPLLLNPTSLLRAFHREVIEKKPEEFKIQCLSDIKALFPIGSNPFYAGYGNRVNDVCAYQTVGIPIVRIFTINHRGELKHELTQTFQSSYSNMSYIVDQLFPPVLSDISEDFSQCIYWREPLPELDALDILPLVCAVSSSPLATIPEGASS